jgi:tetratricopeptide (TPR) repeat protein
MSVVKDTLESRLDAEKQARKEVSKTREQLETVLKKVDFAGTFFNNYQKIIQNTRQAIEASASRLAQTPRHKFKPIANDLINFARQFDTFNTEFELLEEEPRPEFSRKALYVRGVAALYTNQPETAKHYLVGVTGSKHPEPDDLENTHNRRLANAHYYIGIIELNFGNIQTAIDSFEQANKLDSDRSDFMTRVVTAEAYVMSSIDEFSKASRLIDEIENELNARRNRDDRLDSDTLRIKSRASIIRANMVILKHEGGWQKEAENLLIPIYKEDPAYYYGTYSLAQIYALQNKREEAQRLFQDAYGAIERSGDLLITTEARSLILIHMVAGICCRHGLIDEKRSDNHLDKADGLRSSLPRIDSQICTVFSALSKFNERSETIHDHIELIRKGDILLEGITRAKKNSP